MRVKNRKMHVHDSGFLRYFCVEMHLLSLSRHLFCAKAQCPGCHGALLASIVNHSGGNLDDVSISTSTARNSRTTARKEAASYIKKTFSFTCGQINFDGKLLQELGGTEKVNRLAVVAVQEEENQLLCVTKTEDSTG